MKYALIFLWGAAVSTCFWAYAMFHQVELLLPAVLLTGAALIGAIAHATNTAK